jgi:hypothetical protein
MLGWVKHGLLFFLLSLTSVSAIAAEAPTISAPSEKPSYLFVMRAEKASILKVGAGYLLLLKNLEEKTLYFADRPVRKAGLLPTSNFIAMWEEKGSSFDTIPPNAALIHRNSKADNGSNVPAVAVELSKPRPQGNNSWQFNLTILEGSLDTGEYEDVSLFIDDYSGNFGGW